VCLFEGFWVVFWVFLGCTEGVRVGLLGFSFGFALAPFVYSLYN
jgi:hypothetical protein